MRQLLIDGDIVAYQQSFLTENPVHWGDDFWTLHSDAKEGRQRTDVFLQDLKSTLNADELVIAVSSPTNFRKELCPTYKENRAKQRKPLILGEIREHLIFNHKAIYFPHLEADDVIGILATSEGDEEKILVSIDKDFRSIPGFHYNWNQADLGIVKIDKHEADKFFMMQTLTGDQVDGYPGCPGIGPKRAEGILENLTDLSAMWEAVKAAFKKAGFGESEALLQARMARILRNGEYNSKTNKIDLWRL
jgi:5'-3' exonuclease